MKRRLLIILFVILQLPAFSFIAAQQRTTGFGGKVVDAQTGEALPFVQVGFVGTTVGTTTDLAGKFYVSIVTDLQSETRTPDSGRFQMMGYQPLILPVKAGNVKRNAKVELVPKSNLMKTVEITVATAGERPA